MRAHVHTCVRACSYVERKRERVREHMTRVCVCLCLCTYQYICEFRQLGYLDRHTLQCYQIE